VTGFHSAPRAALIAIGTELLADGRHDTNGVTLARILASIGIETVSRMMVVDDEQEIAVALEEASERVALVIATGGLGPTVDDVTREGASRAFHLELHPDERILAALRQRYAALGRTFSDLSARQALVPRGAEILSNAVGTAPGLLLARPHGRLVALLPGVPHEMESMMRDQLVARLTAAWPERPLLSRGIKVAGLTEVEVQTRLGDLLDPLLDQGGGPRRGSVTLLAAPGEVSVMFRGKDEQHLDEIHRQARVRIGDDIFTDDMEAALEAVVGQLLVSRGLTTAVAESCTGGMLAALLTRTPGSSRWFRQGWVTYSDESKISELGVDPELIRRHGAVSAQVADAMAKAARRRSGTDFGLSITGIAGPDGGTREKPVGIVYLSLADSGGSLATRHRFAGDREAIRLIACKTALERLRRRVLSVTPR